MKYAVVQSGGKQYLALEGKSIEVDRLPLEEGKPVELKEVLLVADDGNVAVGMPFVEGARVKATVVSQLKAPKVLVFKYIPKERYRKRGGHRQQYTRLAIQSILIPGGKTGPEGVPAVAAAPIPEARPKAKPAAVKARPPAKRAEPKAKPAAKVAKKPTGKGEAKPTGGKKPAAKKSK